MFGLIIAAMMSMTVPASNDAGIVDQAGLLTSDQYQKLSTRFESVRKETGVTFGLLTVTDLPEDPKSVAVQTLNEWNMTPDSVLVLVSMNPRKIYLQPGTNLAETFSESTSVRLIVKNMLPNMRLGQYGLGILNGFEAIDSTLPRPATTVEPAKDGLSGVQKFLIFLLGMGVFSAISALFYYLLNSKRKNDLDEFMKEVEKDSADAGQTDAFKAYGKHFRQAANQPDPPEIQAYSGYIDTRTAAEKELDKKTVSKIESTLKNPSAGTDISAVQNADPLKQVAFESMLYGSESAIYESGPSSYSSYDSGSFDSSSSDGSGGGGSDF